MASLYDLPAAVPAGVKLTCDLDEGIVTGYGEHYTQVAKLNFPGAFCELQKDTFSENSLWSNRTVGPSGPITPLGSQGKCDLCPGSAKFNFATCDSSAIPPTIERTRNWMFVTWRTPRFVMRVSMKRPDV